MTISLTKEEFYMVRLCVYRNMLDASKDGRTKEYEELEPIEGMEKEFYASKNLYEKLFKYETKRLLGR